MSENNQNDFEEQTSHLGRALEGLNFPADKSKIVNFARSNQLNSEALSVINNLPERRYEHLRDVLNHFIGGSDHTKNENDSPSLPAHE